MRGMWWLCHWLWLGGHRLMAALWHFLGLPQDRLGAGDGTVCPQGSSPSLLPKHGGTHEPPFWTTPQELKLVAMHVGLRIAAAPIS